MSKHIFNLTASWKGGFNGKGKFQTGDLSHQVSIPKEMGGAGVGTNPEALILAASANCYLITLVSILQFQALDFESVQLESKAVFEMTIKGPFLNAFEHEAMIFVSEMSQESKIKGCIKLAEQSCMITRAMQNNVEVYTKGRVKLSK